MKNKEIEVKIKNLEKNILYYTKVYPGSKKIKDMKCELEYYKSKLKNSRKA